MDTEAGLSKHLIRLRLIEPPRRDTPVIHARALGPLFHGFAEADYACGSCDAVLCAGITPGHLAGVVFRCWCGAFSMVPST